MLQKKKVKNLSYAEAILNATRILLKLNKNVFVMDKESTILKDIMVHTQPTQTFW